MDKLGRDGAHGQRPGLAPRSSSSRFGADPVTGRGGPEHGNQANPGTQARATKPPPRRRATRPRRRRGSWRPSRTPSFGSLMRLIKGADSVELKVTVSADPSTGRPSRACRWIRSRPSHARSSSSTRPTSLLDNAGLVVRARRIPGRPRRHRDQAPPGGAPGPAAGRHPQAGGPSTSGWMPCRGVSSAPPRTRAAAAGRTSATRWPARCPLRRLFLQDAAGVLQGARARGPGPGLPGCPWAPPSCSRRSLFPVVSTPRRRTGCSSRRCGCTRTGPGSWSCRRKLPPRRGLHGRQ